jgi:type I restriction enzyme S subunit
VSSVPEVALGDVASIVRTTVEPGEISEGTFYIGLENIIQGGGLDGVVAVHPGELASTKFVFGQNEVLFGKLRPYLAKIARPNFGGVCSTDILPIAPGPRLDRDYLAHFLSLPATVARAAQRATGANLPRLSPKELEKFRLPLPCLDTQRRIAQILDVADALRAKRRQVITYFDDLMRSIFIDMFGGVSGTKQDGIVSSRLADLATTITKGTTPTSVGLTYATAGVPFLRVQDMTHGTVDLSGGVLFIDSDSHAMLKRSRVIPGDILVSIAGTIGRIAVVPNTVPEMNCNQAVAIVRLAGGIDRTFVSAWLRSADAKRQMTSTSVTATISNLSLAQLGNLVLPVPPLQRQEQFAHQIGALDRLRSLSLGHGAYLDTLFAALQDRAFSGGL